jgi:DNA-binding XRE family transcriptional regulator
MFKESDTLSIRADLLREIVRSDPRFVISQALSDRFEQIIKAKENAFRARATKTTMAPARHTGTSFTKSQPAPRRKVTRRCKRSETAKSEFVRLSKKTAPRKNETATQLPALAAHWVREPSISVLADAILAAFVQPKSKNQDCAGAAASCESEPSILKQRIKESQTAVPATVESRSWVIEAAKNTDDSRDDFSIAFGLALRDFRREKGITQEQVAAKAGRRRREVNRAENGKSSLPTLICIATALGVNAQEIVKRAQQKKIGILPSLLLPSHTAKS